MDLVEQTVFPATAANESWASSRAYTSGGVGRTELAYRPESTGAGGDQFILSAMPIRCALYFEYATPGMFPGAQTPLGRSFNVASISANSAAEFVLTFDNAIASTNYMILPSVTTFLPSANTKKLYPKKTPDGKLAATLTFQTDTLAVGDRVNILILGG